MTLEQQNKSLGVSDTALGWVMPEDGGKNEWQGAFLVWLHYRHESGH